MDFWIGATSHGGGVLRWTDGYYFDTRGFNVTGGSPGGGGFGGGGFGGAPYPVSGGFGGGPYPAGGGWDNDNRWSQNNWPPNNAFPNNDYLRTCASLYIYQPRFSYLPSSQIILSDCAMSKRAICQKRNVLEPLGFVAITALVVAAICLFCIIGWICRKKMCCACCSTGSGSKSYGGNRRTSWIGWNKKTGRSFDLQPRVTRSGSPIVIDRNTVDRNTVERNLTPTIVHERPMSSDRVTTDRVINPSTTIFKTSEYRSPRIMTSDSFAA